MYDICLPHKLTEVKGEFTLSCDYDVYLNKRHGRGSIRECVAQSISTSGNSQTLN